MIAKNRDFLASVRFQDKDDDSANAELKVNALWNLDVLFAKVRPKLYGRKNVIITKIEFIGTDEDGDQLEFPIKKSDEVIKYSKKKIYQNVYFRVWSEKKLGVSKKTPQITVAASILQPYITAAVSNLQTPQNAVAVSKLQTPKMTTVDRKRSVSGSNGDDVVNTNETILNSANTKSNGRKRARDSADGDGLVQPTETAPSSAGAESNDDYDHVHGAATAPSSAGTQQEPNAIKRQRRRTNEKCEHGRVRGRCKPCGGRYLCPHDKEKFRCRDCGGSGFCVHNRFKHTCKECGGASVCPHFRMRTRCRDCGGGAICVHGRERSRCKEGCGGGSICEHNRQRTNCKDCGGGSICLHNRQRYSCRECRPRP